MSRRGVNQYPVRIVASSPEAREQIRKERIRFWRKLWRLKHKEHLRAKRRAYYIKNKEREYQRKREWEKANREIINAKRRQRYALDPAWREYKARYARAYRERKAA